MIDSPNVRRIVGPTILLHGGTYFDFLDPIGSIFTIEDVAHGLSNICRFVGQCDRFYSVAQHCVHLSYIVPENDALAGLLHDAPEAFIGDVSKPLKDMMPEYRVLEKTIEAAVLARFDISAILPPSVKEADLVMLVTEQHQLMRNRDAWDYTRGRQPLDIILPDWSPAEAKRQFLQRYHEIAIRDAQDAA